MALEDSDWRKIFSAIADSQQPSTIIQGVVVKNDVANNLIWLEEFGNQPIPLFFFEFTVKYYDSVATHADTTTGSITSQITPKVTKDVDIKVKCPKVGDTVLVLRQYGTRRLPKCIGVLQSTNFIIDSSGD